MEIALIFIFVFIFLALGTPVAVSLGLASVLHIVLFSNDSMTSIALKLFEANQHFLLLAIPFFILSSNFMSTGGVAKRIIRLAIASVGAFRGGLAMAGVFSCMIFAALSGSSPATVVAIGTIVISGMRQAGYPLPFAAGVIANAGTLGILIPPSLVMVVYAAATDVSVGRMFLAGILPGICAGLMLMFAIYIRARQANLPALPWQGFSEIFAAAKDASWGLLMVVIILGGIYGGIFTPTEAAAVAAVYAFVVANFIYRDMGPLKNLPPSQNQTNAIATIIRHVTLTATYFVPAMFHADTRRVFRDSARATIMLMFIIANALLFAHVLTTERIPQALTEIILSAGVEWWSFLIIINLALLLGGQFMEPSGLLLLVAPIALPIAVELGIDPIHLGIIMVVNMEIGLITPPVGLNLFVTANITGMKITEVARAAMPWMLVLLLFLIIVTYTPQLSTFIPDAVMGKAIY